MQFILLFLQSIINLQKVAESKFYTTGLAHAKMEEGFKLVGGSSPTNLVLAY